MNDLEDELRRRLRTAGLPAQDADVRLQRDTIFPLMTSAVQLLYAVPDARYEVPAMRFDPDPTFEAWGEPASTS